EDSLKSRPVVFHSALAIRGRRACMATVTEAGPAEFGVQVPAYSPPDRFLRTSTGSPLLNVTFTALMLEGAPQSSYTRACTGLGHPTLREKLSDIVGTTRT